MASFLTRAPAYAFPAVLVVFEEIVRSAASLNPNATVGASMVGIGIRMLVSLTNVKLADHSTAVLSAGESHSNVRDVATG